MIFRQSLRRDLNGIAGVMFATLFTIMVTTTLTRFLGRAATDRISSSDVFPLIAFSSISFVPILLVLTVFLSVLMVLSRAWKDSEMVVWQAAGMSLSAWIRPVMSFAVPYAIMVGVVTLVVAPWANRQIDEARDRFEQREDVAAVAPGQFRESRSANRVFFVESVDPARTRVRNVFVAQNRGDHITVVASTGGKVEVGEDRLRYLVLENGRRYDGDWGQYDYSLMSFDRYGVRVGRSVPVSGELSVKSMPLMQLLGTQSNDARGEIVNRVSIPISVIIIALLAIPMAYVNPRMGRSMNIVIGVLIYFVYTNFNGLVKAWVSQGKMPFWLGLWVVHAIVLGLTAWMFWRRSTLPRFTFGKLLAGVFGKPKVDREKELQTIVDTGGGDDDDTPARA